MSQRSLNARLLLPLLALIPVCLASRSNAAPPSPGSSAGWSICDLQQLGSQARQIALDGGSGLVHMVWTDLNRWPPQAYNVAIYNCWRPSVGWLYSYECQLECAHVYCAVGACANLAVRAGSAARIVDNGQQRFLDPWQHPQVGYAYTAVWPGFCVYNVYDLPVGSLVEPIFPRLDIDEDPRPGADVFHAAGCDTMMTAGGIYYFVYWRFDGTSWSNPVLMDSGYTLSQLVMADPTTDEVTYVFCRPLNYASPSQTDNDIAFYKSADNGLPWVTSGTGGSPALTNVTNYALNQNGRAYTELSVIYDFNGILHLVWNESRFIPPDSHFVGECELVHWDDASTAKRPIARAFWDNPAANGQFVMNLCKLTIGVGNGWTTCGSQPNNNDLYVTYTRFGGPTAAELNDHSAHGYMNGELYLSISVNGGHTWSPPRNLTNTKTPNCDPATGDSCASENWATMAKTVDDTIHIAYIADRDAGAAPLGEGSWTINMVMYYRIPGGTDGALCPEIAPVLEYLLTDTTIGPAQETAGKDRTDKSVRPTNDAIQDTVSYAISVGRTTLRFPQHPVLSGLSGGVSLTTLAKNLAVDNYGNATLSGNVSVVYTNPPNPPVNWLTVGGAQMQSYSCAAGTPGLKWLAVASNVGLGSGTHHAELRITHNDPHQASPQVLAFQIAGPPCICPHQGDIDSSGFIDVTDVLQVIQIAFTNGVDPQDPECPRTRADVNKSGFVDVQDVLYMISTAFLNGPDPLNPCGP